MSDLDTAAQAVGGGAGGAALLVALRYVYLASRDWLRARRERAEADASVQRSEVIKAERVRIAEIAAATEREKRTDAREERTEEKLWQRLEKVEASVQAAREETAVAREETRRCEEQREQDRREYDERDRACQERVRGLEVKVATLASVAATERRRRRSSSSPGPWPRIGSEEDEWDGDTGVTRALEAIAQSAPVPPPEPVELPPVRRRGDPEPDDG